MKDFNSVLSENGLIVYNDHNGTEQVCFGVFSLFCGGYINSPHDTNIRTILGSDECYDFAQAYLQRLLVRCKQKKSGKNGIKHRISQAQRYLMTHEKVTGKIPQYD